MIIWNIIGKERQAERKKERTVISILYITFYQIPILYSILFHFIYYIRD